MDDRQQGVRQILSGIVPVHFAGPGDKAIQSCDHIQPVDSGHDELPTGPKGDAQGLKGRMACADFADEYDVRRRIAMRAFYLLGQFCLTGDFRLEAVAVLAPTSR